eukprot:gnl/TRDRNA2_/TRDRNA2_97772_c1_seq1.p1 gnl/TRDRNA2_/TRDRNA2_97772_c1~~gnl/TRDRNA2_/TRDRNA2_97772_c1_seq1.p1  ORF type:complete len:110 (+),score=3.01 gnl/TRDRNA2_/TRDRNA2_97772_c1_seq1:81-410(+)
MPIPGHATLLAFSTDQIYLLAATSALSSVMLDPRVAKDMKNMNKTTDSLIYSTARPVYGRCECAWHQDSYPVSRKVCVRMWLFMCLHPLKPRWLHTAPIQEKNVQDLFR